MAGGGLLSRRGLLAAVVLTGIGCGGGAARADSAAVATIRAFYATLLAVMKAAKQLSFDERYARLAPAIDRAFNLALMTRIAVGPSWAQLTQAQRQRLTAAFTQYTVATYADRFDDYNGERFEVAAEPVPNPNGVIVETRLVPSDGDPVTINYLMRDSGAGSWQVIDVFLSGTISELATRRSEFAAVLQREGADGLVRLLESRSAALRTG